MNRPGNILGDNIRKYRVKNSMTQQALADKIGYSKKTVSKWECNQSQPNIDTLLLIADALGVDANALVGYAQKAGYYLGIDGGATKTAFVLCDETGRTVSRCVLSSCNPVDVGIAETKRILSAGIAEVCSQIPFGKISVFAGISGSVSGNYQHEISGFLAGFGFAECANGSDIENAVSLALNGRDGIVSILGTGNVIIVKKGDQRFRIGGYGYFFDDGGSGFDIGKACLRSALKAGDSSGKPTVLRSMCEEKLGAPVLERLAVIYEKGKSFIASFAPLVFEACRQRDPVAEEILHVSMAHLAADIRAAAQYFSPHKPTVYLLGGLCREADILVPILREQLADAVRIEVIGKPQYLGALKNAGLCAEVTDNA